MKFNLNSGRIIIPSLFYFPLLLLAFQLLCLAVPSEAQIRSRGFELELESELKLESLKYSANIPSLQDTTEMAHLSSMVYGFINKHRANDCSSFDDVYQEYIHKYKPAVFIHSNTTFTCHMYERDDQDTQVLVVSKEPQSIPASTSTSTSITYNHDDGYIAIVYAGTDDFRTVLADADLRTTPFGPSINGPNNTIIHPLIPSDTIRVHAGFNNEVFTQGLFDRLRATVNQIKADHPSYRLLTTGHSLGAANAVLTAVAFKLLPEWKNHVGDGTHHDDDDNNDNDDDTNGNGHERIVSINFGCPKTGNTAWREFVNDIPNLGIWRVVNGVDLVPRLPDFRFHHVGHTVQLDKRLAKAFWLHDGDAQLGFKGVGFGWNTLPYALVPAAAMEHIISHYTRYLERKSMLDKKTFYIHDFVKIHDGNEDDDIDPDVGRDDDDYWWNVPDDQFESEFDVNIDIDIESDQIRTSHAQYLELYGTDYLKFAKDERNAESRDGENLVNDVLHVPTYAEAE